MRHVNIPIFIPHLGCPNQCIFCNQRHISGASEFNENLVDSQIKEVLTTVTSDDECEIAFFGGSFTGIDRELMVRLLDRAQGYVDSKLVKSIRLSTRPDYIDDDIISILKNYTISFVELGIQSMNDDILKLLKRGHTTEDTLNACIKLKNAGFSFVGQMMVGLPGSTLSDEIYCAKRICEMGAVGARIYPTVVFRDTELSDWLNLCKYEPLSLDEAVERCAAVLDVFSDNNVSCIRIGLCDSENLHSDSTYIAGPNSPAIGEMVKSRVYLSKLFSLLDKVQTNTDFLTIMCPKGAVSQIVGHRKSNIAKLKERFGFKKIEIIEDAQLNAFEVKIIGKGGNTCD